MLRLVWVGVGVWVVVLLLAVIGFGRWSRGFVNSSFVFGVGWWGVSGFVGVCI